MEIDAGTRSGERAPYGPRPTRPAGRLPRLSGPRAAVLELLGNQSEPCTVSALAAALHQHPNTVREHLDGLAASGLVTRARAASRGRGRPAWLYAVSPDHREPPDRQGYAGLAIALADHLARTSDDPARDAAAAGHRWGRQLARGTGSAAAPGGRGAAVVSSSSAPVPRRRPRSDMAARRELVGLLDRLGFGPEADGRAAVVRLRSCPLLQAVHEQPEVVCAVHLGLARGVLQELGTDGASATLTPFAERGACRLDLLPTTRAQPG